jgi:hypothetical protein
MLIFDECWILIITQSVTTFLPKESFYDLPESGKDGNDLGGERPVKVTSISLNLTGVRCRVFLPLHPLDLRLFPFRKKFIIGNGLRREKHKAYSI